MLSRVIKNLNSLLFKTKIFDCTRPQSQQQAGFTLTELLVATAIGLVVIAAAGGVILAHIRTVTRQATILRFQNEWARVSHFMESEVEEARRLLDDQVCSSGTTLFTIEVDVIPDVNDDGISERLLSRKLISYVDIGGDLYRCGPSIRADGQLITLSLIHI